jgi:hypothetical protein
MIMLHSMSGLAKKPSPANGKTVINNGTIAQCTAQRIEAVIPALSSFELYLSVLMLQIYKTQFSCISDILFFTHRLFNVCFNIS